MKDSFSYRPVHYESLFEQSFPARYSPRYERLVRFSRGADRASSDKTWPRLPVRRLSVGTAPARTYYVISTTRLTRIRGEAGAAYRERERDSDSERRNVTRRACFAVSLPTASGSP